MSRYQADPHRAEGPTAEAADTVHVQAQGLDVDSIIPVTEGQ